MGDEGVRERGGERNTYYVYLLCRVDAVDGWMDVWMELRAFMFDVHDHFWYGIHRRNHLSTDQRQIYYVQSVIEKYPAYRKHTYIAQHHRAAAAAHRSNSISSNVKCARERERERTWNKREKTVLATVRHCHHHSHRVFVV